MEQLRPVFLLNQIDKLYPKAWKYVEDVRARERHHYPSWCYLSINAFQAIVRLHAQIDENLSLPMPLVEAAATLAVMETWRVTQGVYRFDPDVYEAVRTTPIYGDLPSEIFYQIPEWCVYIETPNYETVLGKHHGFFAFLNFDETTSAVSLRLLVEMEKQRFPIILSIGNWSVFKSISKTIDETIERVNLNSNEYYFLPATLQPIVESLLSLLLYVCSQNGAFDDPLPSFPMSKKVQDRWQPVTDNKPKIWHMGVKFGTYMRKYCLAQLGDKTTNTEIHLRPSQWDHSLIDKSSQDNLPKRILRWIPPIPVNTDNLLQSQFVGKNNEPESVQRVQ